MSAPDGIDTWECASCIAWNGVEEAFCQSCGRERGAPAVEMPGMKRYAHRCRIEVEP